MADNPCSASTVAKCHSQGWHPENDFIGSIVHVPEQNGNQNIKNRNRDKEIQNRILIAVGGNTAT